MAHISINQSTQLRPAVRAGQVSNTELLRPGAGFKTLSTVIGKQECHGLQYLGIEYKVMASLSTHTSPEVALYHVSEPFCVSEWPKFRLSQFPNLFVSFGGLDFRIDQPLARPWQDPFRTLSGLRNERKPPVWFHHCRISGALRTPALIFEFPQTGLV